MAMSVGSPDGEEDQMNSAINTTPLVDVMLVLLIIFLITIPVVTQSVGVKLPEETNIPRQTKPENIEIAVTRDGSLALAGVVLASCVTPYGPTLILMPLESFGGDARGEVFAAVAPSSAVGARELAKLKPKPVLHLAGEKEARSRA